MHTIIILYATTKFLIWEDTGITFIACNNNKGKNSSIACSSNYLLWVLEVAGSWETPDTKIVVCHGLLYMCKWMMFQTAQPCIQRKPHLYWCHNQRHNIFHEQSLHLLQEHHNSLHLSCSGLCLIQSLGCTHIHLAIVKVFLCTSSISIVKCWRIDPSYWQYKD